MHNKVLEEKFASIIDAVCYWLGYQLKIGREQLIHEASLRYPIADSITSKGIAMHRIVLEKLHPIFKSKKIDLVIYDETVNLPETEKDDSRLIEVFELKLAKSKTAEMYSDEHQRVFDDVVRLAYYNMWGKKECYFLMCGTFENFKTYFVGQKSEVKFDGKKNVVAQKHSKKIANSELLVTEEWQPDGLYKDWFGFKIGESKTIKFDSTSEKFGLKPFQKNYEPREIKNKFKETIEIKTTCVALSSVGETMKTHAAGIWKIEAIV